MASKIKKLDTSLVLTTLIERPQNLTTTETILAAKVQNKSNDASPCSTNKRAPKRVILVALTLLP
jgi:hypothetical protein